MPYVYRHSAFTVTVESGFVNGDRFTVAGRVAYRPDADRIARGRAGTAVLLAMLAGIAQQSQFGQALGAHRIYVDVEGDPRVTNLVRRTVEGNRYLCFAKAARSRIEADH